MTNPENPEKKQVEKKVEKDSEQKTSQPDFKISPLSENPDTEKNTGARDNVSKTNEEQNDETPNEQIFLDEIIKEVDEEGGEKETVLSLTKEFLEDVDYRQIRGEDPSDDISEHGKEVLTKNGFSKEEIEKMTKQEAISILREKIKEQEIQSALEQGKNKIEQEAEEAGLSDRIRKIGESYNKVPLKYKFLIGATLGIGSVALSGAVAAGCVVCLFSQRALGGAGTFVAVESLLQRYAEKDGRERGKWEKRRHGIEAALLGVAVGSRGINLLNGGISFLSDYFDPSSAPVGNSVLAAGKEHLVAPPDPHHVSPDVHHDLPTTNEDVNTPNGESTPSSEILNGSNETNIPSITEASVSQPNMTFTVGEETKTLWGGIEKTLQDQGYFDNLDEGRQTFLIDSIKDKFATMSPDELREIGISSGNISIVHPGETIDLSSVLEDSTSVDKLAEQARELPDSVSDQIWAQEHPGEALSGNTVGEITENVSGEGAIDNVSTEIENQNTPIESNFPETKITEGAPVLEPQPLEIHLQREELNELYGNLEKNSNIPGAESPHWIGEKDLSLNEKTIETIVKTNPNLLSSDGIGIESKEAVSVTQEHIRNLSQRAVLSPQNNETIEEFFKKAYAKLAQ